MTGGQWLGRGSVPSWAVRVGVVSPYTGALRMSMPVLFERPQVFGRVYAKGNMIKNKRSLGFRGIFLLLVQ